MQIQIRDPVHNFIELNGDEQRVLAIPVVQRLRGIRQLAMASLVYPGAIHTRFDHTLGVMHIAGQMAESLELGGDEIRDIRLAALLHDIGHGPFSHVSEHALERYAIRSKIEPNQKREKIHELVTGLIVKNDPGLAKVIASDKCDRIAKLLAIGHGNSIMRQVISGPLDADKQDYLLRDSYFCGVQYGVFDHRQLHRSLHNVAQPQDQDHVLMIRPDGVHAVEQFVLAKYYLTTYVYRHKVRLITDQMIVRAIRLGIEHDQNEELQKLYAFDNSPEFVFEYARWDDNRFLQTFGANNADGKCGDLLQRLSQRKLFKRVFSARPEEFGEDVREQLLPLAKQVQAPQQQKILDDLRRSVEHAVAEVIGSAVNESVDPDYVIYHAFDVKSVKEMSRNDEASILVQHHPLPRKFEEESVLFDSINDRLNDELVEVYAPIMESDRIQREQAFHKNRDKIIDAIEAQLRRAATEQKP